MATKERLNVKTGDEVAFHSDYGPVQILKVTRVTPTGRIYVDGYPYQWFHPDGWAPQGDSRWPNRCHLSLDVDSARAEARHFNLEVRASRVKWKALPTETLEAVLALVDAATPEAT
jgi:hypothetical protein